MASTMSPTRSVSERPSGMTGSLPIDRSQDREVGIRILPTMVASATRPSASCT